jgi:hypothetical protein
MATHLAGNERGDRADQKVGAKEVTQAGPAIPVIVVSDRAADAGPALRVVVVADGRPLEAGPARPIIVVNDGRPTSANDPLPIVVASGAQAARVLAGPAIPIVLVSGSLGAVFRSAAGSGTVAAGTSLVIPVPPGVQNGDVMLAAVAVRGGSGVTGLAIPGWANLFTTNQSTNVQLGVFFKVAASEPANYTATWVGSFNAAGGIYAASRAVAASPLNGNQANVSSVNVTAPSISPTVPPLLVFVGGMSAGATFTPPPTMQERLDVKSTAGATNAAITFADEFIGVAGATGIRIAVADSAGGNVGALVAFAGA